MLFFQILHAPAISYRVKGALAHKLISVQCFWAKKKRCTFGTKSILKLLTHDNAVSAGPQTAVEQMTGDKRAVITKSVLFY